MGYVSLKNLIQYISPSHIAKSAGTWTPTVDGHTVSDARSAAAAGFYLIIPITIPGSFDHAQGAKIKSVNIWYKVGTAAMADMAAVSVKKLTLPADTVAASGADYASITIDADHDSASKRKTKASHKMTITFTNPPFIDPDEGLMVLVSCEGAATSDFSLYGAQVNYELRL